MGDRSVRDRIERCRNVASIGLVTVLAVTVAVGLLPSGDAPPPPSQPFRVSDGLLGVPHYRQGYDAWGRDELGRTGARLAAQGCTVSCAAMVLTYYGFPMTPGELNRFLRENNGYTRRGWLIWEKCLRLTEGRLRLSYVGPPCEDLIRDCLDEGVPVIGRYPTSRGTYHWVVIVGQDPGGYWVMDPAGSEGPEAIWREPRRLDRDRAGFDALRILEWDPEKIGETPPDVSGSA